jgi:hypothetical protein
MFRPKSPLSLPLPLVVLLAALAGGCSSSSSSSSPPPPPVPATLLFFHDNFTGAMIAVDPRNVGTTQVDSGRPLYYGANLTAGSYDASSGLVTSARTSAIGYLMDDGLGHARLFRLDAALGSAAPTPVRVSNLSVPWTEVCCQWSFDDYAHPDQAQVVVASAGANHTCFDDDDELAFVPLDLTSIDDPAVVTTITPDSVSAVYGTNGAIASWLLFRTGKLVAMPSGLASSHTLASGFTNRSLLASAAGRAWMKIDGDIKYWSLGAASLADPGGVATTLACNYWGQDGQYLYLSDSSGPADKIVRVKLDGSAPAEVLYTAPSGVHLWGPQVGANRLLFAAIKSSGWEFFTLPKAGGSPQKVFTPYPDLTSQSSFLVGSALYFDVASATTSLAVKMADDSTDQVEYLTTAARQVWWFTAGTSFPIGSRRADDMGGRAVLVRAGPAGGGPLSLRSFDAKTGGDEKRVGVLPGSLSVDGPLVEMSGTATLLYAGRPDAGNDVFFADLAKDDSVQQLTSTAVGKSLMGRYGGL